MFQEDHCQCVSEYQRKSTMNRLLLVLLFVYVVSATRCIIKDDKDEPEVRVIRLGDRSSGESDESEVVTLHIPDSRRKRAANDSCKKDSDCSTGKVCVPYLGCIRGHRKNPTLQKHPTVNHLASKVQ